MVSFGLSGREQALCLISGAVAVFGVHLWGCIVTPMLFARRQRDRALAACEPCILDTSVSTVALFRRGGLALIDKDLAGSGLPAYVVDYVHKLLIARGADQAFRTKVELVNYKKMMVHMQKALEEIEANLSVFSAVSYCGPQETDKGRRKAGAHLAKELDELRGILHVVRDVRTWTAAICKVPRFPSTERMFIASDAGISKLPPEMSAQGGLQRRVDDLRALVEATTPNILNAISVHGWPPSYTFTQPGKHTCRHCEGKFGPKWIQSNTCWLCRHKLRAESRCPYENSAACVVCPHRQRCLRCERVSCSQCRLFLSPDIDKDEGIVAFVRDKAPRLLIFDFDQTLCETKSGCVPDARKHGLNPDLFALALAWQDRALVVSRQPHANQGLVTDFLRAHGLAKVRVHCIGGIAVPLGPEDVSVGGRREDKRKMKKSDVIIPILRQMQAAPDAGLGVVSRGGPEGRESVEEGSLRQRLHDDDVSRAARADEAGEREREELVVFFDDDMREVRALMWATNCLCSRVGWDTGHASDVYIYTFSHSHTLSHVLDILKTASGTLLTCLSYHFLLSCSRRLVQVLDEDLRREMCLERIHFVSSSWAQRART
jgi:hypothetical protein